MSHQLLDAVPLPLLIIGFAAALLLAYEAGFRIGRWRQEQTPDRTEVGPSGVLVGSLLGLMAFLLGITMGMAADRFDRRRAHVMEETIAIETTYLRAGYQPSPYDEQVRELLREYTPLRIATSDPVRLAANATRSREIHEELWAITEELVGTTENTDLLALFVESVNEVIAIHDRRAQSALHGRVPESIVLLLFLGSILVMGMVGYSTGLTERRSVASAVVLMAVLSIVTVLVVDLDRPTEGFIQVSQRPLLELQQRIGPPGS